MAHGNFLSPCLLESLGVYVLTHSRGVADRAGIGEGGRGHSSRDKSVSNRVDSEDAIAVRIIETFAVCVKLRTDFLEALSMFSVLVEKLSLRFPTCCRRACMRLLRLAV